MAAGIDTAGLVLAVLPVVIDIVTWYDARVRGRDTNLLAESLENNKQMFVNSIQYLLQSVVPPSDLRILLEDLKGPAWQEDALSTKVNQQLGPDASKIFRKIGDIYKDVSKLQEKLPQRSDDRKGIARAKHVIKCFVRAPHDKASLERLRMRIVDFRELTDDAVKLGELRKEQQERNPEALQNVRRIRECASGLHDALQGCWQCACEEPHPANIKLENWTTRADSPEFDLLFADDAKQAHSDHWMTAVISSLSNDTAGMPSVVLNSIGDASSRSITLQSGVSPPSQATSPTSTATPTLSPQDTSDNLCPIVRHSGKIPRSARGRALSISDSNGHNFNLKSDQSTTKPEWSSISLADFLNRRQRLSNKNRVRLALTFAWAVLQISPTSWLSGKWTKENILLVMDDPENRVPYVSHHFAASRRRSVNTLRPTVSNEVANWIKNDSLFALGVVLLEVCYNRSIEDLATSDEKGPDGQPHSLTPCLTAMRLSNTVQDKLGQQYADAVNACLYPSGFVMDAQGNPRNPTEFAKSIFKNVIDRLEKVEEFSGWSGS